MRIGVGLSIPELATRGGRAFSPASLFTGGVQGAWYAPDDFSTLFQDSAGTTPVTAVEQPVRLMLDKSQGLVLGSELVTNGDFSGGSTGWTITGTGWAIGSGIATHSGVVSGDLTQACLTVGKTYKITATITGTGTTIYLGDSTNLGSYTGSFSAIATCAGSTTLRFRCPFDGVTIDNISVKEIPGNHALAPNDLSRPVLRARYNLLTYSEQFDNAVWTKNTGGVASAPTVTANAGLSPIGDMTADRMQFLLNGGTTTTDISDTRQVATVGAGTHTFSFWIRSYDGTSTYQMLARDANGFVNQVAVTGSWQRVTLTATYGAGSASLGFGIRGGQTPTNSNAADVLVWGADLRTGSSAGTYQRIAAATDYATAGFLPYLEADGVDDSMSIPSAVLTGATSATEMHSAWRPAGNATGNGSVFANFGTDAVSDHEPFSDNTLYSGFASTNRQIFATLAAIENPYILEQVQTGTTLAAYRNGTQLSTTKTVTFALGSTPRLFFASAGAGFYYRGRFFGGITISKVLSASETTSLRNYLAAKSGVTL